MNERTNDIPRLFPIAAVLCSLGLAGWVLSRAFAVGFEPDAAFWGGSALTLFAAAAAGMFGRSLCSCAVGAVFAALSVTGSVTGAVLGVSSRDALPETMCAAVVFLLVFSLTDRLLRLLEYRAFLVITAVLSAAVYVITLLTANRVGGAALGIDIFGTNLQIFELGKPLYIIITASVLCMQHLRPSGKLLITLAFTLLHCCLLLAQSEMGTMLCILAAYIGQLTVWLSEPGAALRAAFWDGWRKFLTLPAMAAVAGAVAFILHRHPQIITKAAGRIDGWLNGTYQVDCGMKAMVNGGLTGMADSQPVYIPYADSDMVFPSVIQHFGLVAGVLLILVFAFFAVTAVCAAGRVRSTIACSLAAGPAVMLTMQTLIAICASTGLMPMTGITLPFISNGGVSLSVCAAFAGMTAYALRKTKEDAK